MKYKIEETRENFENVVVKNYGKVDLQEQADDNGCLTLWAIKEKSVVAFWASVNDSTGGSTTATYL